MTDNPTRPPGHPPGRGTRIRASIAALSNRPGRRHRRPPTATLTPDGRPDTVRIGAVGGTGYLRPDDVPHMSAAERRVFELMRDGRPHTAAEIAAAAGGWDPLRRLRALRGRRAHVDGRVVTLTVTCTRGRGAAGVYTLTMTPAPKKTHRKTQ